MAKSFPLAREIPPLFPDQKRDIAQELEVETVCDWSEPGTGKTRKRIEVFAKRRTKGGKCALVFAPKSILRAAWEADVRTYAGWLKVSVAFAENRKEAFAAKADMYIVNHDGVKWVAKQPPSFFAKFDYLVIDESDAFKHHTSQRSKAMQKIKKYFRYRAVMNGAPNTVSITDVWHQVNIVDDGKRLGTSFYAFRGAVCVPEQVGPRPNMVKWTDRVGSEEQVAALIRDISQRSLLKNVPKNWVRPPVEFILTKPHMLAYRKMEEDAILQLKSGEISAVNAAVLSTKLLQIASGAVYDDTGKYHVISRDRYELVADMIEARRHTVVFFLWQHQRDLLIEELAARKLTYMLIDGSVSDKKRAENIQMYQAGMFRTALLHPKSAAHGTTLTRGTSTIWPSPTHDLAWFLQGNARIARTGQKQETETISVLAKGTYEEKVHASTTMKNVKLIDLLRSIEA